MNILVFAPHNDDEVLGVGGTMRKHIEAGDDVYVCEVTSGPNYLHMQTEARAAHAVLGVKDSFFLNLPVAKLADYSKIEINASVDKVVKQIKPEIVYMPFLGDMHLDHRVVTEAVLVAIRPMASCSVRKAYMYETLSETGWNVPYGDAVFSPNVWVDITDTLFFKTEAMMCYNSQLKEAPHPRSVEGITSLASFRGGTIGVRYAESFMLIREIY